MAISRRQRHRSPTGLTMAQAAEQKRLLQRSAPETDPAQDRNKDIGVREFNGNIQLRAEEEDSRAFTLSFSSEEPYPRWFGPEILDHSDGAVDLSRLQDIGVVLFNHDRDEVIGKVTRAWIENNRGCAEIEIDPDEKSENVYQKMKSGTLKGVSVGYRVDSWEEVMPGKQSADGKYTGPCSIARKWAPYEISIVSVPADATVGVGRDMEEAEPEPEPCAEKSAFETRSRQLLYNINSFKEVM